MPCGMPLKSTILLMHSLEMCCDKQKKNFIFHFRAVCFALALSVSKKTVVNLNELEFKTHSQRSFRFAHILRHNSIEKNKTLSALRVNRATGAAIHSEPLLPFNCRIE